jgi:hypothetical protein
METTSTTRCRLRALPLLIQLLQTLHRELSHLTGSWTPTDSEKGNSRMKAVRNMTLKRLKTASAHVAELGFGAEWKECIGLVWLYDCIEQTWRDYNSNRVPRAQNPTGLYHRHCGAIGKLVDYYIPRLQKRLDCMEQETWMICAGMHERLGEDCLFRCIDKNIMYGIMSASVWHADRIEQ